MRVHWLGDFALKILIWLTAMKKQHTWQAIKMFICHDFVILLLGTYPGEIIRKKPVYKDANDSVIYKSEKLETVNV